MNGINMPDNEWLTGKLYVYNEDYDQTRKEIKQQIEDGEFVADDDYDDEGYMTIFTYERYKQYVDNSIRSSINGGFVNRKSNKQIEMTSDTKIKENDRFKLMEQLDDDRPFKVTEIDYNRNTSKSMATFSFPGLYDEYNQRKILTLE